MARSTPHLLKAAKLLGGYVGGGMLTMADAEAALRSAIECKANVDNLQTAYQGIVDGLNYGEQNPIEFEDLERQRIQYLEGRGKSLGCQGVLHRSAERSSPKTKPKPSPLRDPSRDNKVLNHRDQRGP